MIETNDRRDPRLRQEKSPVGFRKRVTVVISKVMTLHTTDYDEHVDCDGRSYCTERGDADWESEFKNEYMDVPELMKVLERLVNMRINAMSPLGKDDEHLKIERVIRDCRDWEVEGIEIEEA